MGYFYAAFIVYHTLLGVLAGCLTAAFYTEVVPLDLHLRLSRQLQQHEVEAEIRVANLSSVDIFSDEEVITVDEYSLRVRMLIAPSNEQVMEGAYFLGPADVSSLFSIVGQELFEVPPATSLVLGPVDYPGMEIRGQSLLSTLEDGEPRLRIPSLFAPFHTGVVFQLDSRNEPPGVTINFSNLTVLLPNVTYDGIYESGFMDFFELGTRSRICFSNSMFVLKSCKGFTHGSFHIMCCTTSRCNVEYTLDAIRDLGYFLDSELELLTCHDPTNETETSILPPMDEEGDSASTRITILAVAITAAAVACVAVAVAIVWCRMRMWSLRLERASSFLTNDKESGLRHKSYSSRQRLQPQCSSKHGHVADRVIQGGTLERTDSLTGQFSFYQAQGSPQDQEVQVRSRETASTSTHQEVTPVHGCGLRSKNPLRMGSPRVEVTTGRSSRSPEVIGRPSQMDWLIFEAGSPSGRSSGCIPREVRHGSNRDKKAYMATPSQSASKTAKRMYCEQQLDSLGAGYVVLNRYRLLGPEERCHGGMTCHL